MPQAPITGPRPLRSAIEAVAMARSQIGAFTYWLGTGDMDTPLTGRTDCMWAFLRTYGVRRHRPGYNRGWRDPDGRTPSVVDDINYNALIEDADHARDLVERADRPQAGDILCYPTIYLPGHDQPWIGHGAIILDALRVLEWDAGRPDWSLVEVAQCCGPDGRTPGVIATDGSHWNVHDAQWPKPEHRTALLRVRT